MFDRLEKILRILRQIERGDLSARVDHRGSHDEMGALDSIEPFDVVFLDLEMPNVDSYQMFEILHKYGFNKPIIACTVHTNEMETARDLGFNGFVSKPLDPLRFTDQISSILSGQPVWDGE